MPNNKHQLKTWAARHPHRRAACRSWTDLGEGHTNDPAPAAAERGIGHAVGAIAAVVEAVARARQTMRTGLAEQNLPDFPWRLASAAISCGPRASAGRTSRRACPSHRIHDSGSERPRRAHLRRGRRAAGEGPLETGRGDSDLRPSVSEEAVARDAAAVDGPAGVSTDSGNEGPLFRQRCERPVDR